MVVPKTTESRCRDGNVQETQKNYTNNPTPACFVYNILLSLCSEITGNNIVD